MARIDHPTLANGFCIPALASIVARQVPQINRPRPQGAQA
jgi:hypothetical protein